MEDRNGNYMYVDVGGGSTEINLLSQGELVCSRSYNIGTVRILNRVVRDSEWMRLKEDMTELALSYPGTNIIGSGGKKPDRADVIVPAGDIFTTIGDIIKAEYVYVPVIGLADGIIDELYAKHKNKIVGVM